VSAEAAARTELRTLREHFAAQLEEERTAAALVRHTLAGVERELSAARLDADVLASNVVATAATVEALEEQRTTLERACQDAESRARAALHERDVLSEAMAAAKQAVPTATASAAQAVLAEPAASSPEPEEFGGIEVVNAPDEGPAFATGDEDEDDAEEIPLDGLIDDEALADVPFRVEPEPLPAPTPAPKAPPVQPAAPAETAVAVAPPALDIHLDGVVALLVSLSPTGAQVLSPSPLRPNSLVKVALPFDGGTIACKGKIEWAQLETSSGGGGLQFRAGVNFSNVDETALAAVLARYPSLNAPHS
jgi:hypothetical protein